MRCSVDYAVPTYRKEAQGVDVDVHGDQGSSLVRKSGALRPPSPRANAALSIGRTALPRFLAELQAREQHLPAYVEREFEDYLKCGRLEHGFLRVRCDACHDEKLVMVETAARCNAVEQPTRSERHRAMAGFCSCKTGIHAVRGNNLGTAIKERLSHRPRTLRALRREREDHRSLLRIHAPAALVLPCTAPASKIPPSSNAFSRISNNDRGHHRSPIQRTLDEGEYSRLIEGNRC